MPNPTPARRTSWPWRLLPVLLVLLAVTSTHAEDGDAPNAERGYRHILDTPYVPASFDEEVFSNLWRSWPEPQRDAARGAVPAERRRLMYARYGFTPRPDDPQGPPLQLAVGQAGTYHLNCFTCHGGEIQGRVIPGLPNTRIALQTLMEDARETRRLLGRPQTPGDLAAAMIPHGGTIGTTNAVVFSIVLLQFRDRDLNVVPPRRRLHLPHHDLDAPPWWHYKRRTHLYVDGFTPVGHRSMMQFLLVPQNGRERVLTYEDDFRDIQAWIKTVAAPEYPHAVDRVAAAKGRIVFDRSCASCHGTYGKNGRYPNRLVPIETVGTDRARLDAIRVADRVTYSRSWLTGYDPAGVRTDPGGYVAPPLNGLWATAPYLHNGSVPTLWHLLFPAQRPALWRRTGEDYDQERVGLAFESAQTVPTTEDRHARREWFDTSVHGKSAAGHVFPAKLGIAERRALLEYLKTL